LTNWPGVCIDIGDEGGEDAGGHFTEALDGVEVVRLGQVAIGRNQQVFQAFLPGRAITHLPHLVADQLIGQRTMKRADRIASAIEQLSDAFVRQVRNRFEVGDLGVSQAPGGWVAVNEFEHPAGRDVLDLHRQFGVGAGQELVQLVDEPGALFHQRLQAQGDLAEALAFDRDRRHRLRPLADGEVGTGAGFDRIGLLLAVDAQAIVLVALRVAAGDRERGVVDVQFVQPGEEVVGIGAGDVGADIELDVAVFVDQVREAVTQLGVAGGGFDHFQFGGGLVQVGVEEGGIVAVARGVDADADDRRIAMCRSIRRRLAD
jgi:hypothetical protein